MSRSRVLFQRKIALDAMVGALVGGVGCGACPAADRAVDAASGGSSRAPRRSAPWDFVLLALLPLGADRAGDLGCAVRPCSGHCATASMIARFFSFLLLLYALGFILFAVTLASQPAEGRADRRRGRGHRRNRPDRACDRRARARQGASGVLIAGADPLVTKKDLRRRASAPRPAGPLLRRSRQRIRRHTVERRRSAALAGPAQVQSVRLITSDWHMRRARYEFRRVLDGKYDIVPDARPHGAGLHHPVRRVQ